MYSICIKFKETSGWRAHVRTFTDWQEVEDYLNEKWHVWPVSHAFVFQDGQFKTKYIFSPAQCARLRDGWQAHKESQRRLYGNYRIS